ncbi:MAG: hypothetical protein R3F43_24830 [bacterium]
MDALHEVVPEVARRLPRLTLGEWPTRWSPRRARRGVGQAGGPELAALRRQQGAVPGAGAGRPAGGGS